MIDPTKVKLDAYEQDIEDHFDELVPLEGKELEKEMTLLRVAADTTIKESDLAKRVNLRVKASDIAGLKSKAAEKGIPYQTLLSSLIHQYVTGQIEVRL